jgi:hypothetical protein
MKIGQIGPEKSDNFCPSLNNVDLQNIALSSHSPLFLTPNMQGPKAISLASQSHSINPLHFIFALKLS